MLCGGPRRGGVLFFSSFLSLPFLGSYLLVWVGNCRIFFICCRGFHNRKEQVGLSGVLAWQGKATRLTTRTSWVFPGQTTYSPARATLSCAPCALLDGDGKGAPSRAETDPGRERGFGARAAATEGGGGGANGRAGMRCERCGNGQRGYERGDPRRGLGEGSKRDG